MIGEGSNNKSKIKKKKKKKPKKKKNIAGGDSEHSADSINYNIINVEVSRGYLDSRHRIGIKMDCNIERRETDKSKNVNDRVHESSSLFATITLDLPKLFRTNHIAKTVVGWLPQSLTNMPRLGTRMMDSPTRQTILDTSDLSDPATSQASVSFPFSFSAGNEQP